MGILSRLAHVFNKTGRDDALLLKGIEHAKAGRPQEAVQVYDTLIKASSSSDTVRARALFNRALAYSSLKNDSQAIADLNEVLSLPNIPENVRSSARDQLNRVRKRSDKPAKLS
jgi:tetratricopeptide (TPR) repeat protein